MVSLPMVGTSLYERDNGNAADIKTRMFQKVENKISRFETMKQHLLTVQTREEKLESVKWDAGVPPMKIESEFRQGEDVTCGKRVC